MLQKSSIILNPVIKVFYWFHSLNSSHRDIKNMISSLQKAMSNSIYNKETLTQRPNMFIPTQGTKHTWSDQSSFVSFSFLFFFFSSKLSNALCTYRALILIPWPQIIKQPVKVLPCRKVCSPEEVTLESTASQDTWGNHAGSLNSWCHKAWWGTLFQKCPLTALFSSAFPSFEPPTKIYIQIKYRQ